MAKLLIEQPKNLTEYPNSFKRQGAFPLESDSVFSSYEAAQKYASTSPIAYITQPIGVAYLNEGQVVADYYIIGDESGTLIHIGNSNHNLDEINQRIEEIEKFFALEDGESLKDTLDQLIELQKWIEEHLGDFDEFKEQVRVDLETEIRNRMEEDKHLSEAISAESTRATEAEEALRATALQNTNAINNEQVLREEADAGLSVIINTEKSDRQKQYAELQTALNEEVGRAIEEERKISQALNGAVTQLNGTIDIRCALEAAERANAIDKLDSDVTEKLNIEIRNRGELDDFLQNKIEQEVVAREEETESLRAALAEEANTARNAESNLRQQINSSNAEIYTILAADRERSISVDNELNAALEAEEERANKADAELYLALEAETARANAADQELYAAIATETERANKADQELYQAIEGLTEEDIHLKSDLWTYVDIGKITGASDTNRKKIANSGDSLKTVFNAIFGTRQDKQPTITNNASLTATDSKSYSGGEYGTAVTEVTETIAFTLANTGTTNYGYRVGEEIYNGSQTFYYPIEKQEEADIKIVLPEGKTATVLTENSLVKVDNNILYCNFVNKTVQIQITLPADTVETSEQTRYGSIAAYVTLGAPQDASGDTITSFLTYLENEGEPAQVTPPTPDSKKGGEKTDSTGSYKINKGYKYVYWAATDNTTEPTLWNRYGNGQTGIIDLLLSCNAGQYLWVAAIDNKASLYAWNDASGKYNTDKLPTTKSTTTITLINHQQVSASGYYTYRTDKMLQAVNTKFKLA